MAGPGPGPGPGWRQDGRQAGRADSRRTAQARVCVDVVMLVAVKPFKRVSVQKKQRQEDRE